MVSNLDRALDELVKKWLADIKTLKKFWFDLLPDNYGYSSESPESANDFPILCGQPEILEIYIFNELDDLLYVSFPLDGISKPTICLTLHDSSCIKYEGNRSIYKSIMQLCYRFPKVAIQCCHHPSYHK